MKWVASAAIGMEVDPGISSQVEAPTNGGVGIGFSDQNSMENADFIIAGENKEGNQYIFVSTLHAIA